MTKNTMTELFSFALLLVVFSSASIYFVYNAIKSHQLNQQIEEFGVTTSAVIAACHHSTNSNSLTYTFQVESTDGQPEIYTNRNFGSTSPSAECKRGDKITVRYLPNDPNQSIHHKSQDVFINLIGAIVSTLFVLYILGIKFGIFNFPKKS